MNTCLEKTNPLRGGLRNRRGWSPSLLIVATALALSTTSLGAFESYVIRNAPVIQLNNAYQPGATEFIIAIGGDKAGLGSSAIDGNPLSAMSNVSIVRLDDRSRFPAGSGPHSAPYLNIWITDGNGNFAVVANEPTNPDFQPLYNNGYSLTWADLANKVAIVHENSDLSWLPTSGSSGIANVPGRANPASAHLYTFADLAHFIIRAPSAADFSNPAWTGRGTGAPRRLSDNMAWGVNWIFGDTLANYVSGAEGYVVADASVSGPVPSLTCVGFQPPMDKIVSVKKKSNRVLPFKMQILDSDGVPQTAADIAAPVIQVTFDSTTFGGAGGDDLLSSGKGDAGNQFSYDAATQTWQFNLNSRQFTAPGTYLVEVVSGDGDAYTLVTCMGTFVIE